MPRRDRDRNLDPEGETTFRDASGGDGTFQRKVDTHFVARADHWQQVYEERSLWSIVLQYRRRAALAWAAGLGLPPRSLALDIGCGPGFLAVEVARCGLQVHAIDRALPMTQLTRLNAERNGVAQSVRVSLGDAHELAFLDNAFGLLIAVGLLPWLHSPGRAVQEMARVLRPGGYLIVQAANPAPLSDLFERALGPALALGRAARARLWRRRAPVTLPRMKFHTRDEVVRLLSEAGLQTVRESTFGFRPLTFLGRSLVPFPLGLWLHDRLQSLAERGVPGVRWSGEQYLVLARKPMG